MSAVLQRKVDAAIEFCDPLKYQESYAFRGGEVASALHAFASSIAESSSVSTWQKRVRHVRVFLLYCQFVVMFTQPLDLSFVASLPWFPRAYGVMLMRAHAGTKTVLGTACSCVNYLFNLAGLRPIMNCPAVAALNP